MALQLRIRTDEQFNDIVYIKDWLDLSQRGFAFHHSLPGNNHYHIYLFGLDRHPDPMRRTLAKYLPKQNYSISKTAGRDKKPIEEGLAYQYGTTEKLLDPVWSKGIEGKHEVYKLHAEAFYEQQAQRNERKKQVVTEILVLHEEKSKPDRVWERLMNEIIETPEKYEGKTVTQIKSIISVGYLRQLKAIPRPSDLHRYAVSLYHITKHGLHRSEFALIEEDALVEEYLR